MPGNRITANLPSRDFDATVGFYGGLGFEVAYRGPDWLILECGPLELEFFAHPGLEPSDSWFSACVRVSDLEALREAWAAVVPEAEAGLPRLTPIQRLRGGMRMFALIDPDGSLLRCLAED